MDVSRLIDLVKKHQFLYDLCHVEYRNTGLKASTWRSVAKELNHNTSEVKLKWKTIKDGYLKYKKQVQSSADPSKKICEYVWKNHLSFLDDYVVTRKTASSLAKTQKDQGESLLYLGTLQPSPPGSPMESDSSLPASPLLTSSRPKGLKRKKNNNEVDEVLSYLKKEKTTSDAVDHLFKSYAITFKRFASWQQAHIKIEMAKLFANAELDMDNVQQSPSDRSCNTYVRVQRILKDESFD